MEGTATELDIHAKEVIRMKQMLNEMTRKNTGGRSPRSSATRPGQFHVAEEAKSYGLIDKVLDRLPGPIADAAT